MDGKAGEMKFENLVSKNGTKMKLVERNFGGQIKWWLIVEFYDSDGILLATWIPRLEHQGLLAKGLAECEDRNYPPDKGFKGRKMMIEFLLDACDPTSSFEELSRKYKIPIRN